MKLIPGKRVVLYIPDRERTSEKYLGFKKVIIKIIKLYPSFILCEHSSGVKECFGYQEIQKYMRMRKEPADDN